jgi:prepilin-type processing-associated H-X9-DG protein
VLVPTQTVMVGDGGIGYDGSPRTATHLMAPSQGAASSLCRPNPRHRAGTGCNVGWVDGHATCEKMELPFYPEPPDPALGPVGVPAWRTALSTDPASPDYRDQDWDMQ